MNDKTIKLLLVLIAAIMVLSTAVEKIIPDKVVTSHSAYDNLYFPLIRTDADGIRFTQIFYVATDLTADKFLLGDTSAAGMYIPEQPMELIDVNIYGDPDSGDTMCVVIYAANGDAANETVVRSDSLYGTAIVCKELSYQSVSTTYGIVTPTEGLAVLYDWIAGTPNGVTIALEWKYRISDTME